MMLIKKRFKLRAETVRARSRIVGKSLENAFVTEPAREEREKVR